MGRAHEVHDEDRELIARIAARDRAAFETFYERHAPGVFRFVADLVRDAGTAEDVTSDVMIEVWRSAPRYAARARVSTWVLGIAHHKAVDVLRRRRPALVALDDARDLPDTGDGPEVRALDAIDRATLEAALATLSPQHRAVLELTFVHDCSQAEIAEIVGVPVATVKTRVFYAKARLRDALRRRGIGESVS